MELLLNHSLDEPAVVASSDATIVVIEKMGLKREWLIHWLERCRGGRRIVAASSAREIDTHLTLDPENDLVVVSIGGAEVASPEVRRALDEVGERLAGVPLVLLADRDDVEGVAEALRKGVRGYIPTSLGPAVAEGALHLVQLGGTFVPPSAFFTACTRVPDGDNPPAPADAEGVELLQTPVVPEPHGSDDGMTLRQRQVLALLQQGKANKVIAYELSMQESTVKAHIRNLMRKLRATNRTQAALRAYELARPITTDCAEPAA